MRVEAGKYQFFDYKFVLEFDTGGDPDFPYTVWIYHDDKPLMNNNNEQIRREFPKKFNKRHLENFCKKFASDEAYRNKYMIEN